MRKTPILLLIFTALFALRSFAQDTILDHYVKVGLESNLALRQKQLSYEKSLAALREAKGMFFPNISFNARYTLASGGRTIDFPVGDLMNPVYSSLNALTANLPPDQQFPDMMVENQKFNFYRPTEHETKLSLTQPVFNRQIHFNYRIRQDQAKAEEIDVNIFKRELVAEIRKGYYNYLQAWYVVELLNQTLEVVDENVRVNESLFRNDKVTIDVVERSKAEYSKVEQQIAEAEKNRRVAASYLNFLMNKPLDEEIMVWKDPDIRPKTVDMDQILGSALENRREFQLLDAYADASENYLKLNRSLKIPSLIAAVDYGLQGETYEVNKDSDFFLGSLVLRWDLFTGSSNNAKIQQAELERMMIEEQKAELRQQVNLEVIKAYYDLEAAEKSITAARQQRRSAESAFRLIRKKYNQGQASQVEFLDARNTMTNAEENLIITLADYLIKHTELERVAGKINIDEK